MDRAPQNDCEIGPLMETAWLKKKVRLQKQWTRIFKKGVHLRLIFTNFRRKLSIFKKGGRLKFTTFHRKLPIFKKPVRMSPQFQQCPSKIVHFQKKECASNSQVFIENNSFSNQEFNAKSCNITLRKWGTGRRHGRTIPDFQHTHTHTELKSPRVRSGH